MIKLKIFQEMENREKKVLIRVSGIEGKKPKQWDSRKYGGNEQKKTIFWIYTKIIFPDVYEFLEQKIIKEKRSTLKHIILKF